MPNIIKTIAAGQVAPILATGRNFYVVFAPVDIEIKRPGSEFVLYPQGTGLDEIPGDGFDRLEVRNPSLGEITVVLYIGGPLYRDSRSAIIEPKTTGVPHATTTLPANDFVLLNGIPTGLRIRRKAVLLTNKDQTLNLEIRDTAGNAIVTVFPQMSYTLPISEGVRCHNPNGSPVSCNIAEIWWTL